MSWAAVSEADGYGRSHRRYRVHGPRAPGPGDGVTVSVQSLAVSWAAVSEADGYKVVTVRVIGVWRRRRSPAGRGRRRQAR